MERSEFIGPPDDEWGSHRAMLWLALEATKHLKLPVLELGAGFGSTPFLKKYCESAGLILMSYDYSEEWTKKLNAEGLNVTHVTNWDFQVPWRKKFSVALVDESPGDHRRKSIEMLALSGAEIIVVHDSEVQGWNASDYQVRPIFALFKYSVDLKQEKPLPWTTALSNTINIELWRE